MANKGYNKTLTIVSINGPYRDEAAYTLIRLAPAAKEKGINVNFFNYLDGTLIGHRDQGPKEFLIVEQLFGTVLKKGLKNPKADAIACIKCTDACGVTKQHVDSERLNIFFEKANNPNIFCLYPNLKYTRIHIITHAQNRCKR